MAALLVCPECAHEWSAEAEEKSEAVKVVKDSAGNILQDGDTVTIIKDMKVKGSSNTLKIGTKVRNIRLVDGPGDHDIDAKVDGFGPMNLKSSIVKKAWRFISIVASNRDRSFRAIQSRSIRFV